jgi:hypothetical protein
MSVCLLPLFSTTYCYSLALQANSFVCCRTEHQVRMSDIYRYDAYNEANLRSSPKLNLFQTLCSRFLSIIAILDTVPPQELQILRNNFSETVFRSSCKFRKTHTLLGPLQGANQNRCTIKVGLSKGPNIVSRSLHLRTETDPISVTHRRTLRRNTWYFFAAYVGC